MQADPYAPPNAIVADVERSSGSAVKAILLGVLVDVGGTFVLSVIVQVAYLSYLANSGATRDPQAMVAAIHASSSPGSPLGLVLLTLGSSLSVLGGYVCARVARRNEYRVGAGMALSSLLVGTFLFGYIATLRAALLAALSVACNMAGVHWGARNNARRGLRTGDAA